MSVRIEFEIDGAHEVSAELGLAAEGVKDWRKPLGEISGELLKTFDLNFSQRGALFGGWPARSRYYSWPLLEKTGALRKGFRSNIQGNALVLSNVKMEEYGKYHQRGTSRLPRRVIMRIDEARRTFILKAFQRYIIEVTRGR